MKTKLKLHPGLWAIGFLIVVMAVSAVQLSLSPQTLISPFPQFNGLFGVAVSVVGDLNNDGIEEFMVGASSEDAAGLSGAGRVYVYDGATNDTLYTLTSPFPQIAGRFGSSLARGGDVNNDGKNDIIVGAQSEDDFGVQDAGRVYVFNGATGDTLFTLRSSFPDFFGNFGAAVSSAGDVNDDGMDDIIVGAERENGSGISNAGLAYVFSGATGDTLYILESINPEIGGSIGISVSSAGDINKDGFSDLLIGSLENATFENAGRVYIYSGATGDTLFVLETPFPKTDGAFGREVWGVGDLNGDDTSDVAIAAPNELFRVYIYSGATGDTLFTLRSPSQQDIGFGDALSAAGDVNNDGVNDILVGAPFETWGAVNNAGRAYVYSGATGDLLHTLQSPNPEVDAFFGNAVSGGGNLNSDDSSDVIVGAHAEDAADLQSAGRAYLFKSGLPTSIRSHSANLPSNFKLQQNYPNPFNPVTTITFEVIKSGKIELVVFDIRGKRIDTLLNENKVQGTYSTVFDATNLASGVYYYKLKTADFVDIKKMVLIK